jgi:ABC-2 type transport system permease protein
MKTILFIIQKEFKQIFRNKAMLPIIFVLPIMQIVILSFAATFEVTNIELAYIDNDKSPYSRELISKFKASSYFKINGELNSAKQGFEEMQKGKIDVFIEIPSNFEKRLTASI